MAEINYNQVFDAITLALHAAFPAVLIHGGKVKQDLHNGDFNVVPVGPTHTAQMGSRFQRVTSFDVIYYPTETGGSEECLSVADRLPFVLDTVTTPNGDTLHCHKFDCNTEGDTMHCIVSYRYFASVDKAEETSMETLIIE